MDTNLKYKIIDTLKLEHEGDVYRPYEDDLGDIVELIGPVFETCFWYVKNLTKDCYQIVPVHILQVIDEPKMRAKELIKKLSKCPKAEINFHRYYLDNSGDYETFKIDEINLNEDGFQIMLIDDES